MKGIWQILIKYKKMFALVMILVIGAVLGLSMQGQDKKTSAAAPQTAKVRKGDISAVISATGSIVPINSVDISAKITAQIKEVKVKENELVKAGQVLVVLEDETFQAELVQAKEKVTNAGANYDRNKRMQEIGAVSDQQLDTSSMEYNIAKANYEQVMSKLNETIITSPIDGTVIGKPLPAGQTVAQGISNPMVILTVADISKMQIEAQVDQTDIGKVAIGQKVTFTVDAYPDKYFTGDVASISQKAISQQNVIYYTVTINVTEAEKLLKPSMVARVAIVVSESKGALSVPLAAIKTDKDKKYVLVSNEKGQTTKVFVDTGIMGEDRIEVTSGLQENQVVVISAIKVSTVKTSTSEQKPSPGSNRLPRM